MMRMVVMMAWRRRRREVKVVWESATRRCVRNGTDGVRADWGHAPVQAGVVAGGEGSAVGRGCGNDHATSSRRVVETVCWGVGWEFVVRGRRSLSWWWVKSWWVRFLFVMQTSVVLVIDVFWWVGWGKGGRGMGLSHVVLLLMLVMVDHRVVVRCVVRRGHAELVVTVVGRAEREVGEAVVLHDKASGDAIAILASTVSTGWVRLEFVLHAGDGWDGRQRLEGLKGGVRCGVVAYRANGMVAPGWQNVGRGGPSVVMCGRCEGCVNRVWAHSEVWSVNHVVGVVTGDLEDV